MTAPPPATLRATPSPASGGGQGGGDPTDRLAEIETALLTRAPIALDFALMLAEAKPIYEALHPETRRGGDRKSREYREKIKAKNNSFCSVWAARLDLTARAVELTVALGEAFGPAEVSQLRASHIADNAAALRAVAALAGDDRAAVIAALAAQTRLRAALIQFGLLLEVDPQEQLFRRFVALWEAASPQTRRRLLAHAGVDGAAASQAVASACRRKTKIAPTSD